MLLACFMIFGTGLAMAAEVQVPTAQGSDLLLPLSLKDTVPEGEIFVAYHELVGKRKVASVQIVGENMLIPGGVGTDIHPFTKDKNGKVHWMKLEDFWSLDADFIKFRGKDKPCIHLKH